MFAEKYLVKKAYFELSNETMKFAVPEPGPVSGRGPHVCLTVIGANGADKYHGRQCLGRYAAPHFVLHPED